MKAKSIVGSDDAKYVSIQCLGCNDRHVLDLSRWSFNGNFERPTFSPSLLVRSGHYVTGRPDDHSCWCTYNEEQRQKGEPEAPYACQICHSFIRDGRMEFLSDSTHALAGQTVDLPDIEENAS